MPQDGGWIQLMEVPTRRVRARAHLMVNEVTDRGWRGRLESVRTHPQGAPLPPGHYIALFGRWSEPHVVEVADDARGPRIASVSGEPSVLRERSGD